VEAAVNRQRAAEAELAKRLAAEAEAEARRKEEADAEILRFDIEQVKSTLSSDINRCTNRRMSVFLDKHIPCSFILGMRSPTPPSPLYKYFVAYLGGLS